MWVRKFRARTLPEAMAQVKLELGPEAVILHTSQVRVGGFFGLFGKSLIEVTAAADQLDRRPAAAVMERAAPPPAAPAARPAPAPAPLVPQAQALVAPDPIRAEPAPVAQPMAKVAVQEDPELVAMRTEMESMRAMMGLVLDRIQPPGESTALEPDLKALHEVLCKGGVEDAVATDLILRVRECLPRGKGTLGQAKMVARDMMLADLGVPRPVETGQGRRVVAIVGSTGVGKTTTLAKLAAHFSLGQGLKVGLITADTYRVAAVEQLRTYSDILGVPLEVVYDPTELPGAVSRLQGRDLVLVDTAGRSHRNAEHMNELQVYLETLRPNEIYLALSLSASFRAAVAALERYQPLGVQRIIYTKLDEAEAPGLIYTLTQQYKLPISYITTGQNVPDDIEVADPQSIIQAILGD